MKKETPLIFPDDDERQRLIDTTRHLRKGALRKLCRAVADEAASKSK